MDDITYKLVVDVTTKRWKGIANRKMAFEGDTTELILNIITVGASCGGSRTLNEYAIQYSQFLRRCIEGEVVGEQLELTPVEQIEITCDIEGLSDLAEMLHVLSHQFERLHPMDSMMRIWVSSREMTHSLMDEDRE